MSRSTARILEALSMFFLQRHTQHGANGKHFTETGNWLPRFTRDPAAGPVVVVVADVDSEIEINI